MKKITLSMLLFSYFICFSGCIDPISPIVGPIIDGYIRWVEGEAHKYYTYDSTTIYRAARRAANKMNLPLIQDDAIDENGDYYLIIGENDRFKVKIIQVEPNITRLSIRVNIMGDKPYAELFYKNVDEDLGVIEFGPDGRPKRRR